MIGYYVHHHGVGHMTRADSIARALDGLFADRGDWDARRTRARAFVEATRNWSSNILRYLPVYQQLTGTAA